MCHVRDLTVLCVPCSLDSGEGDHVPIGPCGAPCRAEAGSYLRLIDSCITQLKAQGPSRTCNESKEEERVTDRPVRCAVSSPENENFCGRGKAEIF